MSFCEALEYGIVYDEAGETKNGKMGKVGKNGFGFKLKAGEEVYPLIPDFLPPYKLLPHPAPKPKTKPQ
jgi:hypothetical protein